MHGRRLWLWGRGPIGPRCFQGKHAMIVAALKTLTWGTVAAAVVSALLLACAGNSLPRLFGAVSDPLPVWSSGPELIGLRATGASEVDHTAHRERAAAPR